MPYQDEIAMYPDIKNWLKNFLRYKFRKANKIIVEDTHSTDLSNVIINKGLQKYFPEYVTYKIRNDITGFILYKTKCEVAFVECKPGRLNLKNLSQLIGYSIVVKPIISILLSPKGIGNNLNSLLVNFGRTDILKYKAGHYIIVAKWDISKKDLDYQNSITSGQI